LVTIVAVSIGAACAEPRRSAARASASISPASVQGATIDAWPALPDTSAAAAALVARETRRPIDAARDVGGPAILAAITANPDAVVAGDREVARWVRAFLDGAPLGEPAFVLVGTWHDAPGQIDAFRHLVGPGGAGAIDLVAVELFRADGAWLGASAEAQAGDGALLDAFVLRGDVAAFDALAASHRDVDYAAWKLGYVPHVLDLLVAARARGVRLRGCDMPSSLVPQALDADLKLRVREIHCAKSLEAMGARRVALLWGDAHLRPEGLRRFLPKTARVLVVHLVGERLEPGPVDQALARRLGVAEPLLVPLARDEAALILPDAHLGARVDRTLARASPGEAVTPGVSARAEGRGVLVIGARRVEVGPERVEIAVAPGDHTWVWTHDGRTVAGALRLEPGHRVELDLDAAVVGYAERAP
jgi:hypothetical protein